MNLDTYWRWVGFLCVVAAFIVCASEIRAFFNSTPAPASEVVSYGLRGTIVD